MLEAASMASAHQKHYRDADERRVALRKGRGEVPWLSGIKFSSGPDVQLINISSTGVLVESGSRFAPGSTTELHLSGPETNLVIPVRFIRSAVARTDELGVRLLRGRRVCESAGFSRPPSQRRSCRSTAGLASLLESVFATARERSSRRTLDSLTDCAGCVQLPRREGADGSAGSSGGLETLSLRSCLETIGCLRHCRSCSTAITQSPTLNSRCSKPAMAHRRRPRAREARQPSGWARHPNGPAHRTGGVDEFKRFKGSKGSEGQEVYVLVLSDTRASLNLLNPSNLL